MMRILLCLLLLSPAFSFAQEWKTFNNDSILFTAKYPADWVNKIKDGKRVFFTSPSEGKDDAFAENINISVSTNSQYGTTLKIDEFVQPIFDNVKKTFIEFTEETRQAIKWNGIDAYEITYSGNRKEDEKMWFRFIQRFCFYKSRLYMLTYVSLKSNNKFTETARQIINSIKFKP
jgi:hypothetical protein